MIQNLKLEAKIKYGNKREKELAVVQIITSPEGGGAEVLARKLAIELNDRGFNSFIIYFSNPRNTKLYDWEFVLKSNSYRSFINFFYLNRMINKLNLRYKKLILHSHLTWPFFYISLLKNSNSIVKVHTEHNTFNKRRLFPFLRYFELLLYNRYNYIICISKSTKKHLENWLSKKIPKNKCKVIYNGSRKFKISSKNIKSKDKIRIVSIGSLTYQKGFDIAIKSINLCKEKVDKYLIYGEGPERVKLERLIKKLKLENKVFLKGYRPDIHKINLDSDLALITSRWEGFGLVAIEFLSAGIPVIASSIEGLREILYECKVAKLVSEINENKFAKAIKTESSNTNLKAQLAINYSKKFSYKKMLDLYIDVYDKFF